MKKWKVAGNVLRQDNEIDEDQLFKRVIEESGEENPNLLPINIRKFGNEK